MFVIVAQPHDLIDSGEIGRMMVTFELNMGSPYPGTEISLTCAPGLVARGDRPGHEPPTSRNAANKLGFVVTTDNRGDPAGWSGDHAHPFVDTLTVTLDVRAAARKEAARDAARTANSAHALQAVFDAIVHRTVDCILDNATRSQPPIHHVRLRLLGPAAYHPLARVYAITPAAR